MVAFWSIKIRSHMVVLNESCWTYYETDTYSFVKMFGYRCINMISVTLK